MNISNVLNSPILHQTERYAELEQLVMESQGIPKMVHASVFDDFSREDASILMVKHGIYVFPTYELAEFISTKIAGRSAIEIGAGNGVMAKHLGITATDSYSQSPDFRPEAKYAALWQQSQLMMHASGNVPVTYGENVLRTEGVAAVIKHRPEVVLGQFITHKYRNGDKDGNVFGVEEHKLLKRADYIMIGNLKTHKNKPLLSVEHEEIELDGLVTRAAMQDLNRIFIFKRQGK